MWPSRSQTGGELCLTERNSERKKRNRAFVHRMNDSADNISVDSLVDFVVMHGKDDNDRRRLDAGS